MHSGNSILNGDNTPTPTDGTDFGNVQQEDTTVVTFTITNEGTGNLNLTGTPRVTAGGGDFNIASQPGLGSLAPRGQSGSTTTFSVRLPSGLTGGLKTGVISFENDDIDEDPYTFEVQGTVLVPEIDLEHAGVPIFINDPPSVPAGTDFGTVTQTSPVTVTFTINNPGTGNLNVASILLSNTDFSVTPTGPLVVGPSLSETFAISIATTDVGPTSAVVTINSNDLDEPVFTFGITVIITGAEIRVLGLGHEIVNGDTTPRVLDNTDFGPVLQTDSKDHIFFITNDGDASLILTSLVVGAPFVVQIGPPGVLLEDETASFVIRLPSGLSTGQKTASVTIDNNDIDEDPYIFEITALVVVPEIAVSGNTNNIVNNDITPSASDGTFLGTTIQSESISSTFQIDNIGQGPLFLGTALLGSSDFVVTDVFASVVPPGESTTFTVSTTLNLTPGTKNTQVSFSTNDPDENPFSFSVQASITAPDIELSSNGQIINNNDFTPDPGDNTDYGTPLQSVDTARVYTITNTYVHVPDIIIVYSIIIIIIIIIISIIIISIIISIIPSFLLFEVVCRLSCPSLFAMM